MWEHEARRTCEAWGNEKGESGFSFFPPWQFLAQKGCGVSAHCWTHIKPFEIVNYSFFQKAMFFSYCEVLKNQMQRCQQHFLYSMTRDYFKAGC